ncbi:hypothetical protein IGB42_03075 [Andreprevotia sp. IGB-42]|uniref:SMI1/KNR4 family protein n=1 Tax=Andreprevotia sp. IGB-42 TaxID=2497473 RepID=UPI001356B7A3|nr:SMI1/KNR4 family protein [Andreprevotia sp. IGB-42]KAF0812407.1 hypothetical protein IGB42_03075 [Andreprevotia sp. IGB-42]
MDVLEQLITATDADAFDIWRAIPASSAVISAREARLGVTLPPGYIAFLEQFGALAIGDTTISGILDDALDDLGGGSVLGDTLRYREEWQLPATLVVIQADDDAPYCLDTGVNHIECAAICYELCTRRASRIATDFAAWFAALIHSRLAPA